MSSLRDPSLNRGYRILLADDTVSNLGLARKLLEAAGYSVDTVQNGHEAVQAVGRYLYDLILMDIQMPVMDGIEAARRIRQIDTEKQVPIIAFTALANEGDLKARIQDYMNGYIMKPLDQSVFLDTVNHSVDRRLTVLVVDDQKDNRNLIKKHLEHLGMCRLLSARNGVEAISTFTKQLVSLILMDMEMPVMDGYTAARTISGLAKGKETPIIAMTGHEGSEEFRKCLKAGCIDYLPKPVNRKVLLNMISKYTALQHDISAPQASILDPDLSDLIPVFINNLHQDLKELRRLLAGKNYRAISMIGHSLKGSGGGFGFSELSAIGGKIDTAARAGDHGALGELLELLAEHLSTINIRPDAS